MGDSHRTNKKCKKDKLVALRAKLVKFLFLFFSFSRKRNGKRETLYVVFICRWLWNRECWSTRCTVAAGSYNVRWYGQVDIVMLHKVWLNCPRFQRVLRARGSTGFQPDIGLFDILFEAGTCKYPQVICHRIVFIVFVCHSTPMEFAPRISSLSSLVVSS